MEIHVYWFQQTLSAREPSCFSLKKAVRQPQADVETLRANEKNKVFKKLQLYRA